jgi:hypothetical protein
MKVRVMLSIIRVRAEDPNEVEIALLENKDGSLDSIMSPIRDEDGSIITALKLAKEYMDIDMEWLDIQPVGFFDLEQDKTVVLCYRARISHGVPITGPCKMLVLNDLRNVHEKIRTEELDAHLRSISV